MGRRIWRTCSQHWVRAEKDAEGDAQMPSRPVDVREESPWTCPDLVDTESVGILREEVSDGKSSAALYRVVQARGGPVSGGDGAVVAGGGGGVEGGRTVPVALAEAVWDGGGKREGEPLGGRGAAAAAAGE